MTAPYEKHTIVWVWKLHVDSGKHIPELSPKFVRNDSGKVVEEIRYFNVEGKKRPAIVWTSNSETTKLIMLTSQGSHHVKVLGRVLDNGEVSHFEPNKRLWQKYPNRLIESESHLLSNELQHRLYEELNNYEMTAQSVKQ